MPTQMVVSLGSQLGFVPSGSVVLLRCFYMGHLNRFNNILGAGIRCDFRAAPPQGGKVKSPSREVSLPVLTAWESNKHGFQTVQFSVSTRNCFAACTESCRQCSGK